MASSVATPLEKQFSTIAGLDNMNSIVAPRARPRSRSSSTCRATSTPRRRTSSRRSRPRRGSCRPNMPSPALLPEGQPGGPADPLPRADLADAAALELDEYGETMMAQRISTVSRRGAGPGLRLAEVRRARPARPARSSPRRGIGIDEVADAVQRRQRQPADRHPLRPDDRPSPSRPTASLTDADGYRPVIVAYRNGSPVRARRHRPASSTASRTTRPPPGTTTSARSRWRSSSSPARTRSRWPRRSRKLLPTFQKQLPAVGVAPRPLRPLDVDPRLGQRRALHAAPDARASSSSSSSSSCATSRRPSSRASRSRSRSSARSPSCTCSATASTTSRSWR